MEARKFNLRLTGDGYAVSQHGIVKVIGGQVYICDVNLADLISEFEGRWVEIAIADPNPSRWMPLDEKIKPLVLALQEKGFVTLSSCQGHWPDSDFYYPFVSYYDRGETIPLAPGWTTVLIGQHVTRLRTIAEAWSETELNHLHRTIEDQLKLI